MNTKARGIGLLAAPEVQSQYAGHAGIDRALAWLAVQADYDSWQSEQRTQTAID